MQIVRIVPGGSLRGEVGVGCELTLPGDKSLSHRAALLAALADGVSVTRNFLVSGVTQAMLNSLSLLGVPWELKHETLTVTGVGLRTQRLWDEVRLDCGNSATTLRLLAGALAAWGRPAVLDGSPGLRRRPMERIIAPLRLMGVEISGEQGCAPLQIQAGSGRLKSFHTRLPVASAQVKSCLLLAALAADGEVQIDEPGPSRDHTERMLRAMGVRVENFAAPDGSFYSTRLNPPQGNLHPLDLTLPGDISAAAFLIVAALITPGAQLVLRGVGLNPTRTGLVEALLEMGAAIRITPTGDQGGEPVGDLFVEHSPLQGGCVSGTRVVRMIDEFPIFAVAAAYAAGETIVREAQELRVKESDRISTLGGELRRLGIAFHETEDGFIIQGGRPLSGAEVSAHGDHRLALALSVAGLGAQAPVSVAGAEIMNESFPGFVTRLRQLGAEIQEE